MNIEFRSKLFGFTGHSLFGFFLIVMCGSMNSPANAATYEEHVVGGMTFLQPWKAVDPGMTWGQMEKAAPKGFKVASVADIKAAMAAEKMADNAYSDFLQKISGKTNKGIPEGCIARLPRLCWVFVADPVEGLPEKHQILRPSMKDGRYDVEITRDDLNLLNPLIDYTGILYVKK